MSSETLPPNWSWVKLGDVCNKITDGTHFTPKYITSGISFISVKDIYNDKIHFDNCKYISKDEHLELIKRCKPELGDVLITKSGTIGRIAIVSDKKEFSLFVSVALLKPKIDLIDSQFLGLALKNYINNIDISQTIKGGLLKNYHIEDIKETTIPLPPLPEQKKIVEKIEELFSGLDSGVASLKKAKELVRLYRQSVLAAAFSGKLLTPSAGRKAHSEMLKAAEPKVEYSNQLPDGWKWVKLGEVSKVKGGKRLPKGEAYSEIETKFPYIRVTDFENMSVRISELRYLKKETQTQIKNYIINKDDLYISIAGTIGRVGMIPSQLDGANLTENAAKITEIKNYDIRFLSYQMNSAIVQNQIKSLTISTTQPKLALFRIEKLDLVQPPIIVQHQIVSEIEKRFSEADNLEKAVDESLAKSETLRQSILKQAFEGKLV